MPVQQHRNKPAPHSVAISETYNGPIPHPVLFQQYGATLQSAPERILSMAEDEAKHRRGMELEEAAHQRYMDRRVVIHELTGLLIGGMVAVGAFALSAYTFYLHMPVQGSILGTASIVSLAGVFVYGSRRK